MNESFWNKRFEEQPLLYGVKPNAFFKEELEKLRPGLLLLPGEGEGRNAIHAAVQDWGVVALDQSEVARENALRLARLHGVVIDYFLGDALLYLPPAKHFDAIALIYFHLPQAMRKKIHHKLVKAIRPGGTLILEGFSQEQIGYNSGGPKAPEMLYDLEELKAEFKGLDWEYTFSGEVHLDEGEGHQGPAHVVRLVGKKK